MTRPVRILAAASMAILGCNVVSGLDEFAIPQTTAGSGGGAGSTTSTSQGGGAPVPCVKTVAAHRHQTCALLSDASLWCFGDNGSGQLGDGTGMSSAVPVRVASLPPIRDVVTAGSSVFALANDGSVYAWGANGAGQLGMGHMTMLLAPAQVPGLTNIARIAAGTAHACAIDTRDNLYCWGSNLHRQLATLNSYELTPVPVMPGIRDVAAGRQHSCALDVNGHVLCWGANNYGQLGAPANVTGSPMQVDGTLLAVEIAASGIVSCARSTAGRVFCWGWNSFGQVGDVAAGTVVPVPREIAGVSDASAIAVSGRRACALTGGKQVWCWGELGVSSPMSPSGVTILGPNQLAALDGSETIGLGTYHACLLGPSGLTCTGLGTSGQLGNGSFETTGRFVQPMLPCDAR